MELLAFGRLLWRRRLAVAVGVLLALAAAYKLGGAPPSRSAIAWTRVDLDTAKSQLVVSNPAAYGSLPGRAELMLHELTGDDVRRRLAGALRVPRDQVNVVDPTWAQPLVPASLPAGAAKAAAVSGAGYVLTPSMPDGTLPLISLQAGAPDAASAKRLLAAAVSVLAGWGNGGGPYVSPFATGGGVEQLEPFRVQMVDPVRTQVVVSGKGAVKGVLAAIVLLLGWIAAVAALPPLLRATFVRRVPRAA